MASRDPKSIGVYSAEPATPISDHEKFRANRKYLGSLPQRQGPPPKVAHWVIPHRQVASKAPSAAISHACQTAFDELAAKYRDTIKVLQSVMERRGSGLFLSDVRNSPAVATANRGEIAHFHASDCSGHVTISHADSIEVIQKGWGERHGLSGGLLPLGYVFLYAPATEEDVEVIQIIMEGAIKFMTDSEVVLKSSG